MVALFTPKSCKLSVVINQQESGVSEYKKRDK